MFISYLLWICGGITLLWGVLSYTTYKINKKEFKGYKNTRGVIVEHISLDSSIKPTDNTFGFEVINYKENDQIKELSDSYENIASVIEFSVSNKKHRIIDAEGDSRLKKIGSYVDILYNSRKHKDAFVFKKYDGTSFFVIGLFLIMLGTYIFMYI